LKWGFLFFCQGWPRTTIFPISTSQIAGNISKSY
jgi:hypothetical protein